MNKHFLIFIYLLSLHVLSYGQVFYEGIFSPALPSLEKPIQLSDSSSVSFANNTTCSFMHYKHIGPTGEIIQHGKIDFESGHSLGSRLIGRDSVLVWYRMGPMDYHGTNYFKIKLWTPSEFSLILEEILPFYYWDDIGIPYNAYILRKEKVVYQKEDSLYVYDLLTQSVEKTITLPGPSYSRPVSDHLLVFSSSGPPVLYDVNLSFVYTWQMGQPYPFYIAETVALDSCLVGIRKGIESSLHILNVFNESSFSLDLSAYLDKILKLYVHDNVILAVGKRGSMDLILLMNDQFEVMEEHALAFPEIEGDLVYYFGPDRVYGWRRDGLSKYKANYRICYAYSNANPVRFVDIALDAIWVDSVELWPVELHRPATLFLSFLITNHSSDTITSFTVHSERIPYGQCDSGVIPIYFSQFSIPPGESDTIAISIKSEELAHGYPFVKTFYIQHANNHLDSNILNNQFEIVHVLTNTSQPSLHPLAIWPNPFTDYLQISPATEAYKLVLYNLIGIPVSAGWNHLEGLDALSPGIYFLKAETGDQSFIFQVVKHNKY